MPPVSRRWVVGAAGLALAGAGCFSTQRDSSVRRTPVPGPGATVSPSDPAIDAGAVDFPVERDRILAYRARPRGRGPFPSLLVLPDNRGLSSSAKELARRFAKGGYLALAIDFLSRSGGTDNAGDLTAVNALLNRQPLERAAQDVVAATRYLESLDFVNANALGAVGADFGATVGWIAATELSQLKALVVVGGDPPASNRMSRIKAAVLGIYAAYDRRQIAAIDPLKEAMARAGAMFTYSIIPGVERGFFNELNVEYNEAGAREAWDRILSFLENTVSG
ncbi:MAG: dienelactone hydrolase family protein [Dehalococcoidia bacterium]